MSTEVDIQMTKRSRALFERSQRVIPGGVSSPVRAFAAVGGTPRFIERGEGAYLWDVDGNRYIDFVMSWGPLIHGHAFPHVVRAISEAALSGTSFGAPTENELRLAEMVVRAVPSVEMVRFVSSGTEATMSAIRVARGYTGRDRIVKFAGNYHGHADTLLVSAGSGALTLGVPSSPGVPSDTASHTLVLPYNDVAALLELFSRRGSELAAVIVEPVAGNMGVVPATAEFLETLRSLTVETGTCLIFDEVITGFRVALGGAQSALGVMPDLTTFGKILGGGLPIGAYGGRAEIMEQVAPCGPVYQAGTLSGNPLSTAAGIANLEPLRDPDFYDVLRRRTDYLARGIQASSTAAAVPVTVNSAPGMVTLFFADGPLTDLNTVQTANTERYAQFFHAMLGQGFYLPPSQFETWMISSCHDESILDETIEAVERALHEVQRLNDQ